MPPIPKGAPLRGAAIELVRAPLDAPGGESPWNVIAYSVQLKSRGVKLARKDFEQCVANFERYPRIPVVLDHADFDLAAHPERARARGWLSALRVGSMQRDGRTVDTLEARMQLEAATRDAVNADPPHWAYCSITIVQDAVNEETAESIGSVLLSLSLTNTPALQGLERIAASADLAARPSQNPALVELPRIQASDERGADAPATDDPAAPPRGTKETPMNEYLKLAAQFGIAAATDDEAKGKVLALAAETPEVRAALRLGIAATRTDVLGAITQLSLAAGKLPALEAKVAAFEKTAADAREAAIVDHVDAYIVASPDREDSRDALMTLARADFAAFAKACPRPSPLELSQRAQDGARLARIVPPVATRAPAAVGGAHDSYASVAAQVTRIVDQSRRAGAPVAFSEGLEALAYEAPQALGTGDANDADAAE